MTIENLEDTLALLAMQRYDSLEDAVDDYPDVGSLVQDGYLEDDPLQGLVLTQKGAALLRPVTESLDSRVIVTCTKVQHTRWKSQAALAGVSLSDWFKQHVGGN